MALWGSKSRAGEQHAKVEEDQVDQVLCCDKRGNSDSILSSEDFELSKAYSLELPLDVSGISLMSYSFPFLSAVAHLAFVAGRCSHGSF